MPPQDQKLKIRAKIQQFVDGLKGNVPLQSTMGAVGGFAQALPQETAKAGGDIVKSITKAPLRVAQTAADLTQQVQGKEPFKGYDVPGLGKVEGYGRQFINDSEGEADDFTNLQTLASGIKAVSEGIMDVSVLAGIAQSMTAPKVKPMTVKGTTPQNVTETIRNKTVGMEKLYAEGGFKPGQTLSPDMAKHMVDDVAHDLGVKGKELIKAIDPNKTTAKEIFDTASKLMQSKPSAAATGPLFSKLHPEDQNLLTDFARNVLNKKKVSKETIKEVGDTLKHYGFNVPPTKEGIAKFIDDASVSDFGKGIMSQVQNY